MPLNLANFTHEDLLRLALGTDTRVRRVRKTGYHARNATTWETTWPYTTTRPWRKPSLAAEKITCVSSSVQDKDVTGTGAWALYIDGLDADGAPQAETVRLDGTTPVDTVGTYKDANVYAVTQGADEDAVTVGNLSITGKTTGKLLAYIPAGACRDQQAVVTVWGYGRAIILRGFAASDNAGWTALRVREPGGVWQLRNRWHAGIAGHAYDGAGLPLVVAAGTQLEMASLHAVGCNIEGSLDVYMLDER